MMKMRRLSGSIMAGICLFVFQYVTGAAISLPNVLSSHMVLQRDMPVPVWGTAAPNEKVTVEFAGQKKEATADAQGHWMVKLAPLALSQEPRTLVVSGSTEKKEVTDVLVGEVWVGSGQSNMDQPTASYVQNDPVIATNMAAGPYPQLRIIRPGKGWMESTPEAIRGFSAQLFSFGLPLHKELKVPVGLMVGAVGGTPSGFWLSQEALDNDQACKDVIADAVKSGKYDEALKTHEANLAKWKTEVAEAKQKGVVKLPPEPRKPLKPGDCKGKVGNLYEKNILPYIPYAIRGVLWDQGESGTAIEGLDQYTLMGALIKGWRKAWGQDFAFIYVQKPSGGGCVWDETDPVTCKGDKFEKLPDAVPNDGAYRELHIRIMGYPNTFMATSSDLGAGIHPVNKSGYGLRDARVALGGVYGKAVEIYGPVYKSHKVEGSKVIVSFDHIGKGLAAKSGNASTNAVAATQGTLQGFAVAGEDGKFVWADAVIDGDTVVMSNAKVTKPVSIRYAWASSHRWANLFNKDGLPALPFRTNAR